MTDTIKNVADLIINELKKSTSYNIGFALELDNTRVEVNVYRSISTNTQFVPEQVVIQESLLNPVLYATPAFKYVRVLGKNVDIDFYKGKYPESVINSYPVVKNQDDLVILQKDFVDMDGKEFLLKSLKGFDPKKIIDEAVVL